MKRLLLIFLAICLLTQPGGAKPARPGTIRYRQPDGSEIQLVLHGNAFGHYATTPGGQVMEPDANGFYRYSAVPEAVMRRRILASRSNVRPKALPAQGNPHFLVLLIEFQDVHFSAEDPLAYFDALMNQEGFSDYGGTGSVRDYYRDNSLGAFVPEFDVFGPIRLDKPMASYGKDVIAGGERVSDIAPQRALYEACLQVDPEVDFAPYDANTDGEADLLVFFFAGHDQAEGASADAIWSHAWHVGTSEEAEVREATFDGVKLGAYFCASELMGNQGLALQGIGTACHEFAHGLGLPDLYDTDGGAQGLAGGLYQFSLMCDGLYNNDSRTPPYLNALERCLLGWMDEEKLPELPEGKLQPGPVQENLAYKSSTGTEGEYFLYENRSGQGWDAPLPAGLAIYHVDRSQRELNQIPIRELWDNWMEYNNLNSDASHPCFYLVPAIDPGSFNTPSAINPASMLFPGSAHAHSYEPMDWEGAYTGVQLTAIGPDDFRVLHREDGNLCGQVVDVSGNPIALAYIKMEEEPGSWAYTDIDGFFLLPLEGEAFPRTLQLSISKPGYRGQEFSFALKNGRTAYLTIVLPAQEEAAMVPLSHYDPSKTSGYFPTEGPVICGVRFGPEELLPYSGMRLRQVDCHPLIYYPEYVGQMYVTVDFGPQRVLNFPVDSPPLGEFNRISADISQANLRIPEGLPIYVGYGFDQVEYNAPAGTVYPGSAGSSWWSPFSLERSSWKEMYAQRAGLYMDLMLSAQIEEVPAAELAEMGFNAIDPGTGHYRAGERFPLQLMLAEAAQSVSWQVDGAAVSGEDVVLTAGQHTIQARLDLGNSRIEILELVLEVED